MSTTIRQRLKQGLRERTPVFGTWTSLGHTGIAEMFAHSGADFLGIDIEHSTLSLDECRQIVMAAQGRGMACLPRIASHNMEMIKRLLDAGADGIICPMVSTPEEVARLVEWVKYPPVGRRSYGVARGQDYGAQFPAYVRDWNAESTLIIQVESITGVEQIDAMLACDEVDGVMIGPYDLSGSLNLPGQLDHPQVQAACRRVVEACQRAGKACGTHLITPEPTAADVARLLDGGDYQFVIFSSDIFILARWSERLGQVLATRRAAR
jgi:2-keto-3-deoxy-L-rhamnonate aldolase RhmA